MDEVKKIVADIKNGNISPIYLLMGEEPYYIDKISEYIEENVLQEEEKGFNQTVMYGRDVTVMDIISACKRFPMMAERQVIIVKEAQELARTIDQLSDYAKNPVPTTVLVLCYKYKTVDKRKAFSKNIASKGVVFESKKLYENQVGDWIKKVLAGKKYTIDPKASSMLVESLGTDLSKISKELDKLMIVLPNPTQISAQDIEENIGISKDYNVFELRKAIGDRNQLKAYQIVNYFSINKKDNPLVMVVGQLFSFFIQIQKYHGLPNKKSPNAASTLGVSPYFLKDYDVYAQHYPMKKVSQIISVIREIDLKSKGVGANNMPDLELYRELLAKIFN